MAAHPTNLGHTLSTLQYIDLTPDASARSKATARAHINVGTTIVSDHALTSALIPEEKGRRCDHCHRIPASKDRLLKCSGCAAFWYCGTTCQSRQWQAHHRRICKRYNRFTTTLEYQTLDSGGKTDALLLSQLAAQIFPTGNHVQEMSSMTEDIALFFDLLKGQSGLPLPPLCRPSESSMLPTISDIFARFGNNNFVMHSHLTSYGHGVFPLASRLFNHSCHPNSVVKYVISQGDPVRMEVVAIRRITEGEEITIPYLDPALPYSVRQTALLANYGFTCVCSLCTFQRACNPVSPLPSDGTSVRILEDKLCAYVTSNVLQLKATPTSRTAIDPGIRWAQLPAGLCCLFDRAYLPQLSETFSKASHEGQYEIALASGVTLLAYYVLVYPANYPQIGMHALELAKTAWNSTMAYDAAMASHPPSTTITRAEDSARHYLTLARQVLECFGPEGDEGGPLEEISMMRELLKI